MRKTVLKPVNLKNVWESFMKDALKISKSEMEGFPVKRITNNIFRFFKLPNMATPIDVNLGFFKNHSKSVYVHFSNEVTKEQNTFVVPFSEINKEYFFEDMRLFLETGNISLGSNFFKVAQYYSYVKWKKDAMKQTILMKIPTMFDVEKELLEL